MRLQRAVQSVHDGLSIRRAAEEYGVAKSTLYDHVSGKVALNARRGRHKHLDSFEEINLASFLINCSQLGCARTRKEAISIAQQAVNEKGTEANVTTSWWKSFVSRHPELSLRVSECVSRARAMGTNKVALEKYFNLLYQTLSEENLQECPCQIFNLDETGMPLDPPPPKVVAKKGQKHPTSLTSGKKSQVTVLACVSAGGYCMPPLVIFKSQTLQDGMDVGEVPGTMYGLSESGWINKEIFSDWFTFHFLKYAPPARPLLLLMDGHSSHFTPDFIHRAANEKVVVMCLPPNSTHRTQPLDKGAFSPLKQAWREECHAFLLKNPGKVVSKFSFSAIFGKAWLKAMTPLNVISGFRNTGIYPLDKTKLLPAEDESSPVISQHIPFLQPLQTPQPQSHFHVHIYQSTPSSALGHSQMHSIHNTLSPSSVSSPFEQWKLQSSSRMSCSDVSYYDSQLSPQKNNDDNSLNEEEFVFTPDEEAKYMRRQEEGYDIETDTRYNAWLRLQTVTTQQQLDTNGDQHVNLLKPTGTLAKILDKQVSRIKLPVLSNPTSSAKVITSEANRKKLKEKEKEILAETKRKELNKMERERKREEKEKERKDQHRRKIEA